MTITLERDRASLVLRTPYSDELKEICAALPGARWHKSHRAWTYPATIGTAAVVHNAMRKQGELTCTPDVLGMLDWARRAADARKYRVATDLPDIPNSGSQFPAWHHQRQAYWYGVEQEAIALEMIMGAGKSRVVVELVNAWECSRILIVCPRNVVGVWPREFRLHSGRDFLVTDGRPRKRDGTPKKTASMRERVENLEYLAEPVPGGMPIAVVVNYDAVWREPFATYALEREWDCVVADEIHRGKTPGAKASKMLARLRPHAARRIGPTGTFLPHTPLDAYGPCRFLEPALFGTSYKSFCVRYGRPRVKYWEKDVNAEGELVETPVYLTTPNGDPIYDGVLEDAEDTLAAKLATITYSCGEEVLDLPGELDVTIDVELNAKAMKVYTDLERELVAEVRDAETDAAGVVVVNNALSKLLRLQQITSGHVPVEQTCTVCGGDGGESGCLACDGIGFGQEVQTLDDSKELALIDWLTDVPADQPVVVFCRFRHDLEAIERAADKTGRAYGEISGKRKDGLNDDGELAEHVRLAGVQIQSGSQGIDLTRARFAVYYSLGFSLMDYKQSRYRIRRPNSPDKTKPCEYVHLVVPGTVDEHVYEALAAREQAVESVLAAMRAQVERIAA